MDYYCRICKEAISETVYQFSTSRFGKPLCLEHQKGKPTKQYFCGECKQPIAYGEFKYSLRNFDKPLCRDCQPEIEEKVSAAPRKPELNRPSRIEFGGHVPKSDPHSDSY